MPKTMPATSEQAQGEDRWYAPTEKLLFEELADLRPVIMPGSGSVTIWRCAIKGW